MVQPVRRSDIGKAEWNDYVHQHPAGWLWHRWEWLDYCLAYAGGTDHSFGLMSQDGKCVGLVPLVQEGDQFLMQRNPTVNKILSDGMQPFTGYIAKRIQTVASIAGVRHAERMHWLTAPPINHATERVDAQTLNALNMEDRSFRRRVVDLRELNLSQVRKSYRQFINKGNKKYVLNSHLNEKEACALFLDLHKNFYGHPRHERTYEIQQELCQRGIARVFLAMNDMGLCEGGCLWYCYKDMAYYASGVYPQDNVAQYLVWESMQMLAREGEAHHYADLGYQGRATTEKEKNIEFFKRGFGGTDWPVPCVRTTFMDHLEGQS